MIPVNSSSIRAVGFDGYHLFVQFHTSDTIYSQPGVPETVFLELLHSTSPGTYYNQNIRGKYR